MSSTPPVGLEIALLMWISLWYYFYMLLFLYYLQQPHLSHPISSIAP